MVHCKIIIVTSICIISFIFCAHQSGANHNFQSRLCISLHDDEIRSIQTGIYNSDLVFTVARIESFLTITGWASDGYICDIGKIIKGTMRDNRIRLHLFHDGIQSKNIRRLKPDDTLILGFIKIGSRSTSQEGFRDKNGTGWEPVFIEQMKH